MELSKESPIGFIDIPYSTVNLDWEHSAARQLCITANINGLKQSFDISKNEYSAMKIVSSAFTVRRLINVSWQEVKISCYNTSLFQSSKFFRSPDILRGFVFHV